MGRRAIQRNFLFSGCFRHQVRRELQQVHVVQRAGRDGRGKQRQHPRQQPIAEDNPRCHQHRKYKPMV